MEPSTTSDLQQILQELNINTNLLDSPALQRAVDQALALFRRTQVQDFNRLLQQLAKDLNIALRGQTDVRPQLLSVLAEDEAFFLKQFYKHASTSTALCALCDDPKKHMQHFVKHIRKVPVLQLIQLPAYWGRSPSPASQASTREYLHRLWACAKNYHEQTHETMMRDAVSKVRDPHFHDSVRDMLRDPQKLSEFQRTMTTTFAPLVDEIKNMNEEGDLDLSAFSNMLGFEQVTTMAEALEQLGTPGTPLNELFPELLRALQR